MAGYRLNESGLICDLTPAQLYFVAMTEQKYLEMMLAPWIDRKPNEEQIIAENRRMSHLARKFKGKDLAGKNLFEVDTSKPIYLDHPNTGERS